MIVYHGSNHDFEQARILPIKYPLDFGVGFYTTKYEQQAVNWALRKARRLRGQPYVYVYELQEKSGLNVAHFEAIDEAWLDFIVKHRGYSAYQKNTQGLYLKSTTHHNFDIVQGEVADDEVIDVVDGYLNNRYDLQEALKRLRYKKHNHQLVCSTEKSLQALILKERYVCSPSIG